MQLQNAKISGFKSFKNLCRLSFTDGITAIVGPNGSGKSNISDAILWVMGESSAKTIRGEKMEDVIFAGTDKHRPLGLAEVSLEFDNATITRRIYRSGDNEYLIDGKQCRKKDIDELLFDTGLGRFGYSVLSQGKVASIISNNPQERKRIFEEATGIAKYKTRKIEAQKELAKTDENIVRLRDIIIELETRLPSLEESSNRAKKYLRLYNTLKELDVYFSLMSLSGTEHEKKKIEAGLSELLSELQENDKSTEQNSKTVDDLYKNIKLCDYTILQKQNELDELSATLQEKKTEREVAIAKKQTLSEKTDYDELIKKLHEELEEIEKEDKTSDMQVLMDSIKKLELQETEYKERIKSQESISRKITECRAKTQALEHKKAVVQQMQNSYSGYNRAVKTVMQAGLTGVIATVGNAIKTDNKYATAIDIAIGAQAQNIICDTQQNSKIAISYLKTNKLGRAVFLPLDGINPNVLNVNLNFDGIIGLAADFVDCKYQSIADFLLGRTILAEDMDSALEFFNKTGRRYRVITLSGDELRVGGAMSGGSAFNKTSFFSDNSEITQIEAQINEMNAQIHDLQKQLETTEEKQDVSQEIADNKHQLELLQQQQEFYFNRKSEQESKIKIASQDAMSHSERYEELDAVIERLQQEIEAINDELDVKTSELGEAKKARVESESKIKENSSFKDDLQERKITLQKEYDRLVLKKEQNESATETVANKLWQEYELTIAEAREYNYTISEFEYSEIANIKRELKELGNVNVEAIDEYAELYARFDLLSNEVADLENAKKQILQTIDSLTANMEDDFRENFAKINENFEEIFKELFDGGKAELSLDNPDDVLESGVNIKIQPPGKSLQSISLLSGGEKAMSAICVLFAILKCRPSPFVFLDEVDAALDDANVTKFNRYLHKMNGPTQFIIITHKRGTMESADCLYGVTMQEKGVSALLKMELTDMEEEEIAV